MAAPSKRAGDLARRVRKRRLELGLSYDDVARRVGMDAGYLEYLEGKATALTIGQLFRLAAALETTAARLGGTGIDRPSGRGRADRAPLLEELNPAESMSRLDDGGIGRSVFSDEEGPTAVPVSFELLEGEVAIRASPGSAIARTLRARA